MHKRLQKIILITGDILILAASFFTTLQIGFWNSFNSDVIAQHLTPFIGLYFLWIITLSIFDLYEIVTTKPTIPHLKRIGYSLTTCLVVGLVYFYIIPFFKITPLTNLFINITIFGVFFFVWRRLFYTLFASHLTQKTVFILKQDNEYTQEFITYLQNNPQSGYRLSGIAYGFDQFFTEHNLSTVDVIITASPLPKDPETLRKLYEANILLRSFSETYEDTLGKIPINMISEDWFLQHLQIANNPLYQAFQRALSFITALIAIIVFLPIFVIVGLAVYAGDRGPMLHVQSRVGKNGRVFRFYKFRSMTLGAETEWKLLKSSDARLSFFEKALVAIAGAEEGSKAVWSSGSRDARVTEIGKIIRKLHVDELPQLFNVLKGDINLIGPRPERPSFVSQLEKEISYYHLRHIITPGFTGWAQIKYRYAGSVMEQKDKFEYDLFYIKNKNIFMDLGILMRTVQIIFTH